MHRGWPMRESFDHPPPGWIRQSRKCCAQLIHNHMVVDYLLMSSVNFAMDVSLATPSKVGFGCRGPKVRLGEADSGGPRGNRYCRCGLTYTSLVLCRLIHLIDHHHINRRFGGSHF